MTAIEKAIAKFVAQLKAEIGYHEKATNAQLDSKTGNSGSNNWNKYAAHIDSFREKGYNFYNGKKNIGDSGEWCDIFYDDNIIILCLALGLTIEDASKMLYQPSDSCGAGCKYSADYYKAAGAWTSRTGRPAVGDQIFFGRSGDETHTGGVVGVDESYVYTIEGNANNQVEARTYRLDSSTIAGYGRPKWSIVAAKFTDDLPPIADDPEPKFITESEAVKLFDRLLDKSFGKEIKEISDIKSPDGTPLTSVQKVMRKLLDCGAVDGGTPFEVNPNDIGLRYAIVRALVISARYADMLFDEVGERDG